MKEQVKLTPFTICVLIFLILTVVALIGSKVPISIRPSASNQLQVTQTQPNRQAVNTEQLQPTINGSRLQ